MAQGIFYGVGVGPGDPDLLTLKAVKKLQEVHTVFVPCTASDKESTALSIVKEHLKESTELCHLLFPMTRDLEVLEASWSEAAKRVISCLSEGKHAAFITLGDPMLYSTYVYMFKKVKDTGCRVETVPGIPSFCAAAASAGFPLAEGEEKMAVLPWNPGKKSTTAEVLQYFDSVVFMKVSSDYEGVQNSLQGAGLLENSVLVSKCGHEDESVEKPSGGIPDMPVPYFSLVLARRRGID